MTVATKPRGLAIAAAALLAAGCSHGMRATHTSIRVTPYQPVPVVGSKEPDFFVHLGKPVRFAGKVGGATGGMVSLRTTTKDGARHTAMLPITKTGTFSMTKTFASEGEIVVLAAYVGDGSHRPSSVSIELFNERDY